LLSSCALGAVTADVPSGVDGSADAQAFDGGALSASSALRRARALFGEIPRLLASTMAQLQALDPRPVRSELDGTGGCSAV
jgi:hypothetical protein